MTKNHVFKRIPVKDLYNQVVLGNVSKRAFTEWLQCYRYKHWRSGVNDKEYKAGQK